MLEVPPVDGVMHDKVPDISERQSRRHSARHVPAEQNERRNELTQREAQQADPSRSSHICTRRRVVLFVKSAERFNRMQNEAMGSILKNCPHEYSETQRAQPKAWKFVNAPRLKHTQARN